jgi:hypothetical protein
MFFNDPKIRQDIINIDDHKLIQLFVLYKNHEVHERRWRIE